MSSTKESKREKVLGVLEHDLLAFGKVVSPATFYLPPPPVHHEIEAVFRDQSKKQINIIAPRGIAKSTIVTMNVIHHLFLQGRGKKVVVIISKTQAHSKSMLSTIKNILNYSKGFQQLFGYHGEVNAKVWREDMIVLDDGNAIITRGTGQPVRGINVGMQRPTLIAIDDPEDENNTKSIEAMQNNLNWLMQGVTPSIDAHRGRIIVIGTPLHEKCIVMQLKEMPDWHTVHYGNDVENGIALWEESRSLEWLKEKREALKSVGLIRMYYQEYECKLIPGEDALFKKDYIQYYNRDAVLEYVNDEPYLKFPSGLLLPVSIYMGVDPASSVRQTADYSVIMPIAVTKELDIYVLDYFRKRVQPLDLAEAIETYYLKYRPRLTLIESNGYQDMLRQYMRTRIFIPGLELKEQARDSKGSRLEILQPFFAQKKVWMKESHTELQDEMLMYPKSKHEDTLDGLYYAVKRIRPPAHDTMVAEPNKLPEHLQVYVEYYGQQEEDTLPTYYDTFA